MLGSLQLNSLTPYLYLYGPQIFRTLVQRGPDKIKGEALECQGYCLLSQLVVGCQPNRMVSIRSILKCVWLSQSFGRESLDSVNGKKCIDAMLA